MTFLLKYDGNFLNAMIDHVDTVLHDASQYDRAQYPKFDDNAKVEAMIDEARERAL